MDFFFKLELFLFHFFLLRSDSYNHRAIRSVKGGGYTQLLRDSTGGEDLSDAFTASLYLSVSGTTATLQFVVLILFG